MITASTADSRCGRSATRAEKEKQHVLMHKILLPMRRMAALTHPPLCSKTQRCWREGHTIENTALALMELLWQIKGHGRVKASMAVKRELHGLSPLLVSYLLGQLGQLVKRE